MTRAVTSVAVQHRSPLKLLPDSLRLVHADSQGLLVFPKHHANYSVASLGHGGLVLICAVSVAKQMPVQETPTPDPVCQLQRAAVSLPAPINHFLEWFQLITSKLSPEPSLLCPGVLPRCKRVPRVKAAEGEPSPHWNAGDLPLFLKSLRSPSYTN